ncbi:MAG: helix-turn-helix domain-containing protein, partial [Nitrospirota bacterium]
ALMLHRGTELRPSLLLEQEAHRGEPAVVPCQATDQPLLTLEEVEMQHIRMMLDRLEGNYTRTAKALGVSLSTLKRKIKSIK